MKQRCLYFALLAVSAFFAFLAACGEGTPVNLEDSPEMGEINIATENVVEVNIPNCFKGLGDGCPDVSKPIPQSSSSEPDGPGPVSSSSSESVLTCGIVPAAGTVGSALTPPRVECDGVTVSSGITWAGTPSAPAWNDLAEGEYSGIKAIAVCGGSSMTASCSGTLKVGTAVTYSLNCATVTPATVTEGTVVTQPDVTCKASNSTTSTKVTSGLSWAPTTLNWLNPVIGSYTISVKAGSSVANCKDQEASCGSLTVNRKTYTITFDANYTGGTVTPSSATTNSEGKLASLPTPTRNGYTLNGWYTTATGGTKIDLSKVYTADTKIYAQWTQNPSSSSAAVSSSAVASSSSKASSSSVAVSSSSTTTAASSSSVASSSSSALQPPPSGECLTLNVTGDGKLTGTELCLKQNLKATVSASALAAGCSVTCSGKDNGGNNKTCTPSSQEMDNQWKSFEFTLTSCSTSSCSKKYDYTIKQNQTSCP